MNRTPRWIQHAAEGKPNKETMPGVFMSYARSDLEPVLAIEQGLRAAGITVWRDQDKLYGGQRWPKALGEAIAANDWLLLCWSKNAVTSTFVELEWCTALALKKTIMPCLLDDTPLPPALSAMEGVKTEPPAHSVTPILNALQRGTHATEPARTAEVVGTLARITATEPD